MLEEAIKPLWLEEKLLIHSDHGFYYRWDDLSVYMSILGRVYIKNWLLI